MYDFTKNQIISMTNNFDKTDLKWSRAKYSNTLGLSCLAFLTPTIFLKRSNFLEIILEFLFYSQTSLSLASDWYYSGMDHWTHGVDRWHASLFFSLQCLLTAKKIHILWPLMSAPAIYCWYMGKKAVKEKNWDNYVYYHSLWHWIGAGLTCPLSTWLACYNQ